MPARPSPVVVGAATVLGFLLVTAVASAGAARREAAPRKAELVRLIERRRAVVEERDHAVRRLREQVAQARREAAQRGAVARQAAAEEARLALLAGTTAVRGRGLVVTLADSARAPVTPDEAGAYRIQDRDLQLVVNGLFASGAEAVALNDNRLVATTPIRSAGDTVVVNFRPVSPPYRVVAIGADARDFGRTDIARRFRRWSALFGLGFDVRARVVTVPAFAGRVGIVSALPAGGS